MDWQAAGQEQAQRDRLDTFHAGRREAETSRLREKYEATPPTTITPMTKPLKTDHRASFRLLLENSVKQIHKLPNWAWDLEFYMHTWPILETESRLHDDPDSLALLLAIKASGSSQGAVGAIEAFLAAGPETPEKAPV